MQITGDSDANLSCSAGSPGERVGHRVPASTLRGSRCGTARFPPGRGTWFAWSGSVHDPLPSGGIPPELRKRPGGRPERVESASADVDSRIRPDYSRCQEGQVDPAGSGARSRQRLGAGELRREDSGAGRSCRFGRCFAAERQVRATSPSGAVGSRRALPAGPGTQRRAEVRRRAAKPPRGEEGCARSPEHRSLLGPVRRGGRDGDRGKLNALNPRCTSGAPGSPRASSGRCRSQGWSQCGCGVSRWPFLSLPSPGASGARCSRVPGKIGAKLKRDTADVSCSCGDFPAQPGFRGFEHRLPALAECSEAPAARTIFSHQ